MKVPSAPVSATRRSARSAAGGGNILTVDDLHFTVLRSPRRRTMQITVERDGSLVLSGPPEADDARLREFACEKRFWIYTRLAERDGRLRSVAAKQFVDGEGFLYLGRSYRLKLVDGGDVPLKLRDGRFLMRRDAVGAAREHFVRWYGERARLWLARRAAEYQSRMEAAPAGVRVQDLGYRWGSCGRGNWLYFHWKTILLPAWIAEYVVVHEIAHLHEPHHTPGFWRQVERAMPDYRLRSSWLAAHGMEVEGL